MQEINASAFGCDSGNGPAFNSLCLERANAQALEVGASLFIPSGRYAGPSMFHPAVKEFTHAGAQAFPGIRAPSYMPHELESWASKA